MHKLHSHKQGNATITYFHNNASDTIDVYKGTELAHFMPYNLENLASVFRKG